MNGAATVRVREAAEGGTASYQVTVTDVVARSTAVVAATTTWKALPTLWKELDEPAELWTEVCWLLS
jgi:hypothetical protein